MMNGAAVSWTSRLQTTTAGSTVHAETTALYSCISDAMGVRAILESLHFPQSVPCPVFEDNQGAWGNVYRAEVDYRRAQSYDVQVWRLREWIQSDDAAVHVIPGNENPADMMTKSLSAVDIARYSRMLMGVLAEAAHSSNSGSP